MTAEIAPGCPVDAAFDPLSPAYLDDPYAIMAALPLAEAPIFYAPSIGYHVVTRHADIAQVFDDPATYSAAVAQAPLVPLSPEPSGSCSTAATHPSRRWSASTSRP